MVSNINIKKLEADLWEAADELRANSKLTSNQYCMPTLALLFLRYAYGRFKVVKAEIEASRPSRGGRVMPVEERDFRAKSALFLPEEARFDYLVNLPDGIASLGLKDKLRICFRREWLNLRTLIQNELFLQTISGYH